MATQVRYPQSNAVITTGWTNPTNAYTDDTAYATAAPAENASVVSDFYNFGFSIPTGSTINSITFEVLCKSSVTTSTGSTLRVQPILNTTLRGTALSNGMVLTDTVSSSTLAGTWTVSEINDNTQTGGFKLRLTGARTSSNTAITWSAEYLKVTVDYTAPATDIAATKSTATADIKVPAVTSASNINAVKLLATGTLKIPSLGAARVIFAPKLAATGAIKIPELHLNAGVTAPKLSATADIKNGVISTGVIFMRRRPFIGLS